MLKTQRYIKYLSECYAADSRGSIVSHIFASNCESRTFFDYEELITGHKDEIELNYKEAKNLKSKAYMYRKEKELLYASTLVAGSIKNSSGKKIEICAPLFFYPAEITVNTRKAELSIDKSNIRVNFGLLTLLYDDNDFAVKVYDKIINEISEYNNELSRKNVLYLVSFITGKEFTIDKSKFMLYPILSSLKGVKAELKKAVSDNKNNYSLINSGVLLLTKKSKVSRGIINETEQLSESENFSKPIKTLFSGKKIGISTFNLKKGYSPVSLSAAQERIVNSCKKNSLSLVIGPPGTGKSFTIAAIALEHLSRDESVLIVSKMNNAVDVIKEKISTQLQSHDCTIRGGEKNYLKQLQYYLKQLLHGLYIRSDAESESEFSLKTKIKAYNRRIRLLEKKYKKQSKSELNNGRFIHNFNNLTVSPNFFNKRRKQRIKKNSLNSSLLMHLTTSLEQQLELRSREIINFIRLKNQRRIEKSLVSHRDELMLFYTSLKEKSGAKQVNIFKKMKFEHLLESFPVWLVNLDSLYTIFPLQKELFDLVIIDEATQCDITSSLPALQRAKRAVVVGDPNQLRHISFLSRFRQNSIAEENNLSEAESQCYNYRDKSILDITSESMQSQKDLYLLNEHFRSLPQIINFSNSHFYNSSLQIMTEKPRYKEVKQIELIACKGRRDKNGVNQKEAKAVLKTISDIIHQEEKLNKSICQKIGVLSPFRKQVDYIYSLIIKKFTLEQLEKHAVLVGTAHTFQGEERDVMLISFTIDDKCHPNIFYFLSKSDILNVAVTRARVNEIIFSSIESSEIHDNLLIREYLEYVESVSESTKSKEQNNYEVADQFLNELMCEFKKMDLLLYPAYSIAGLTIDLVLEYKNKTYAVDIIGFPGKFEESFPLERYRIYHRAGLQIIPLEYNAWLFKKDLVIQNIKKLISYVE